MCEDGQVRFSIDGSAKYTCGQCDPALAFSCGVSQYCSDAGICEDPAKHPLFGIPCVSDDFCGTLRCFNRKCSMCPMGAAKDDLQCVDGLYISQFKSRMMYPAVALVWCLGGCLVGLALEWALARLRRQGK